MKITVIVEVDEAGGFWSHCPDLVGCGSQGESITELVEQTAEAIGAVLHEADRVPDFVAGSTILTLEFIAASKP